MKRDLQRFTKVETAARLGEAKSFLGNKERLAFLRTGFRYLPMYYYPEKFESFYSSPRLSQYSVESMIAEVKDLMDHPWMRESRFRTGTAASFVDLEFHKGAAIGETVAIVFYPYGPAPIDEKPQKAAMLWLGTWHHAPLVAWSANGRASSTFLPKYVDLIH